MNTSLTGEYCESVEATHIRVFQDFDGYAIDAADDRGRYTELTWTHWDDQLLTKEKAIEVVGEFARELGRPELASNVCVSGTWLKPTLLGKIKLLLKRLL